MGGGWHLASRHDRPFDCHLSVVEGRHDRRCGCPRLRSDDNGGGWATRIAGDDRSRREALAAGSSRRTRDEGRTLPRRAPLSGTRRPVGASETATAPSVPNTTRSRRPSRARRLRSELPQNRAPARADRDRRRFTRALGDRDQHDVHDPMPRRRARRSRRGEQECRIAAVDAAAFAMSCKFRTMKSSGMPHDAMRCSSNCVTSLVPHRRCRRIRRHVHRRERVNREPFEHRAVRSRSYRLDLGRRAWPFGVNVQPRCTHVLDQPVCPAD